MQGKITSLEDDEFWKDCLTTSQSTKLNHKKSNSQYEKELRPIYNSKTQELTNNSQIIKAALESEEQEPKKQREKHQAAVDNMVMMYTKSMAQKEAYNKNNKKKKNFIEMEKVEECTFKPRQCRNRTLEKKLKDYNNTKIYQRGVKYQQQHLAKLARLYQEKFDRQNVTYSFQPSLNNNDLTKVFYSDNYCKEQADNDSNKIFLFRLMKAREEQKYKQQRLQNCVSSNLRFNWNYPQKIKRSISQKEGLFYKQTLHDALLNLKCQNCEEEEKDNNK